MKAFVDKDLCIACGLCPSLCPEVFEMQDDGKAGVSNTNNDAVNENEISDELVDSAKEAEDACPVDAIKVE